jgi:hypothetical protein
MPLLSKFVTLPSTITGNPVARESDDPQVQSIIDNLRTVLQSRRTLGSGHKIGLQDYSEQLLGEPLMHQLCADMREQITLHEPRLDAVEVSLIENGANLWRMTLSAKLKQRQNALGQNSSKHKPITCILELAKPAYLQNMRDVKVVMI